MRAMGQTDGPEPKQRVGFWQLLGSTLAAAVGVQSSKNRKRDFTHGKPLHFIAMGLAFTVLFVLLVASVVSWVVP